MFPVDDNVQVDIYLIKYSDSMFGCNAYFLLPIPILASPICSPENGLVDRSIWSSSTEGEESFHSTAQQFTDHFKDLPRFVWVSGISLLEWASRRRIEMDED